MIQINLAPGAAQGRASKRRSTSSAGSAGSSASKLQLPSLPSLSGDPRVAALGAAGLVAVLLVGFAFWNQGAKLTELQARVDQEVTDSTRYATTIALVKSLQARQDTIRQKIGVIRDVDQRRYVWPHLLDEIGRSVPAYTWLTQVSSSAAPAPAAPAAGAPAPAPTGPGITLQGHAGSTQALTRLMKNLEASAFVRDVTLVTSEQTALEGRAVHRFTLEARYETPDAASLETVPIIVIN